MCQKLCLGQFQSISRGVAGVPPIDDLYATPLQQVAQQMGVTVTE